VQVDFMDGGAPVEVLAVRCAAQVGASLAVIDNQVTVTQLEVPTARFDVAREPAFDLADDELEQFMTGLMDTVLPQLVGKLPTMPLPALPLGAKLDQAVFEAAPGLMAVRAQLK